MKGVNLSYKKAGSWPSSLERHIVLIVVGDPGSNPGKDGELSVTHIDGCIVSNKQDMVVYCIMANYHG